MKVENNTPSFGMAYKSPKGSELRKMKAYFHSEGADTVLHKMAFKRFRLKQRNNKHYDIIFKPGYKTDMLQANDSFVVTPKAGVWGTSVEFPCAPTKYGSSLDKSLRYDDDKYHRFLENHPHIAKHRIFRAIASIPYTLEEATVLAKDLIIRPENMMPDSLRQAGNFAKKMDSLYRRNNI